MLREFIRCNSLEGRIELIDQSAPADWSEAELNTVCEIVGITERVKGMDAEECLEVIRAELFNKLDESIENMTTMEKISRLSED